MYLPIPWLFLIAAALFGELHAASAQSPYSYPWCLRSFAYPGATSCYYRSYEECMMSLTGRGGYCIKSPYYRLAPVAAAPVERDSGAARLRSNSKRPYRRAEPQSR
jgi:Protein of unknown function (DUF3551)